MENSQKIAELEQLLIHTILMEKKAPKGTFKRMLNEEILDIKKQLKELHK